MMMACLKFFVFGEKPQFFSESGMSFGRKNMENVEQVPKIEERLPAQFGNGKGSPFIVNVGMSEGVSIPPKWRWPNGNLIIKAIKGFIAIALMW